MFKEVNLPTPESLAILYNTPPLLNSTTWPTSIASTLAPLRYVGILWLRVSLLPLTTQHQT